MFEVVDTDWGVGALVGDVWSATSFVDPKRTCVRHAQTARSGVLRSDEWSALALEANESAPGLALSRSPRVAFFTVWVGVGMCVGLALARRVQTHCHAMDATLELTEGAYVAGAVVLCRSRS
jgi:hypothetical protein